MGKNQSASNLTNIIKQDADGSIAFMHGNTMLMQVSSSGTIETTGNVAGTASYASNAELLDGLDSTVFATTGSNTFTSAQYIFNTSTPTNFTDTASLYTDGGMQVKKDVYLSSSLFIKGDLTIFGTQSVNYITSSQLNISDNIITMNTSTPVVRFGGIAVQDSGSLATGLTGSLLWDSQNNHWIYSNPSGSSYSGGMMISGPRNTGSIGDEQGTTFNALMKGQGGDHITSSGIFESGTSASFYNNILVVSANGKVSINTGSVYPESTFDVIGTNLLRENALSAHSWFPYTNGSAYISCRTGSAIYFREFHETSNTTFMTITGSRVGIGTSIPLAGLQVGNGTQAGINGASNKIHIATTGTRSALLTLANSSGAVTVEGQFESSAETADLRVIIGSTSNHDVAFRSNNVERIRIKSGGDVGIATDSPRARLDVGGAIMTLYQASTLANKAAGIFCQSTVSGLTSGFGFLIQDGFSFQGDNLGNNRKLSVRKPTADGSLGDLVAYIDSAAGNSYFTGRMERVGQPAFQVHKVGENQSVTGADNKITFTVTRYDITSNISNNGRFTAPVTGRYSFASTVRFDGATTADSYIRLFFAVNGLSGYSGSPAYVNGHAIAGPGSYSTSYHSMTIAAVLTLNAGDYVEVYGGLNGGTIGAQFESQFSGFLI
jgi:hypothetical protein